PTIWALPTPPWAPWCGPRTMPTNRRMRRVFRRCRLYLQGYAKKAAKAAFFVPAALGGGVRRLDDGEEFLRVAALLARAVAGPLAASERHVVVDPGRGYVDHDHAGLDGAFEVGGMLERGGADARAQAEFGVVGQRQGVLVIVSRNHGGDRAEDFFLRDAHRAVRIGEHGGAEVIAVGVAFEAFAAAQQACAFLAADVDI